MSERNRGPFARVGVSLLNLLAPGLGLLRIGQGRRALALYAASIGAIIVLITGFSTTRTMSFAAYAALLATAIATTLVVYGMAIWFTWRQSRALVLPRPIWSRWYAIVGAMLVAFGVSWMLSDISRSMYQNFYLPSEAMEPTLYKSDKMVAAMGNPGELRRGDVVLVKAGAGDTYVKRIAALPGDKIELKDGLVIVNGTAAALKSAGAKYVSYPYREPAEAKMFWETLPGEAGAHMIQDLGSSVEDNMSEVVIPPGHIFVLGDNRDNSADSRVEKIAGGLELVPMQDVVGRALFIYWPLEKMGRSLRGGH